MKVLRLAQSLNTFSALINRTRRRDIGSFTTRKPETFQVDFTPEQAAVHADLLDLAGRISTSKGHGQSLDFVLSTLQRQAASSLNGLAPFVEDLLQHKLRPRNSARPTPTSNPLKPRRWSRSLRRFARSRSVRPL